MPEILKYIFLGVIQGGTEFLPVSSSGHLTIFSYLFKMEYVDKSIYFFELLHLATFFAVLLFTYKEIWMIFSGLFDKSKRKTSLRYIVLLLFSTIPAAVVGLLFEDRISDFFSRPDIVAYFLFITAIILFCSDKFSGNKNIVKISVGSALLIGLFQAFALFPGISRSGMTLFAALLVGLSRSEALKYSFLMSLPVTLGAGILHINNIELNKFTISGFFAAFIVGIFGLWLLKKLVMGGKLKYFSIYIVIFASVFLFIYFFINQGAI